MRSFFCTLKGVSHELVWNIELSIFLKQKKVIHRDFFKRSFLRFLENLLKNTHNHISSHSPSPASSLHKMLRLPIWRENIVKPDKKRSSKEKVNCRWWWRWSRQSVASIRMTAFSHFFPSPLGHESWHSPAPRLQVTAVLITTVHFPHFPSFSDLWVSEGELGKEVLGTHRKEKKQKHE